MSAKPNGSKHERSRRLLREGGEEGHQGKAMIQVFLITLWHMTENHRVPGCICSSHPHVCHTLTLDLRQLLLQLAAGMYLSSAVSKTEPEQNHKYSSFKHQQEKNGKGFIGVNKNNVIDIFKHRFGIFLSGF